MRAPRQIRNLALTGFMGVGKSSVGQLVAERMHFRYVDTDDLIEQRTQRRISDIFAEAGEAVFRQYEKQIVAQLGQLNQAVISTGGGLIVDPENLASLKEHALVVCLWASPDLIWERVRHQAHRPLLSGPDPRAAIRQLLEAREPFYQKADVMISTETRTVREVAQHVLQQFHAACPPPPAS